jgi:hypothetical protein
MANPVEHTRFYFPKVGYTRYDEVSLTNRQDIVRLVALTNSERLFLISWNFLRKRFIWQVVLVILWPPGLQGRNTIRGHCAWKFPSTFGFPLHCLPWLQCKQVKNAGATFLHLSVLPPFNRDTALVPDRFYREHCWLLDKSCFFYIQIDLSPKNFIWLFTQNC